MRFIKLKNTLALCGAIFLMAGCATPSTTLLTPTDLKDASMLAVTLVPADRAQFVAAAAVLKTAVANGAFDPVTLRAAIAAAGTGGNSAAITAGLVTILDKYQAYAGQGNVANVNSQLALGLAAIATGIQAGLDMTASPL